jgi:hypothetical protein
VTTLYRLFDQAGTLLYVGITEHWPARRRSHASAKYWWPEVARTTVEEHPDRDAALLAEARAIRTEQPRHNSGGAPAERHQHVYAGDTEFRFSWCTARSCRRPGRIP